MRFYILLLFNFLRNVRLRSFAHNARNEIDYVEESDGRLQAFEFKWNPREKARLPQPFASAYPDAGYRVVSRDNYDSFLL